MVDKKNILIAAVNDTKKIEVPELANDKNVFLSYPNCPSKDKRTGLCCQEANALVEALKMDFDWMFISNFPGFFLSSLFTDRVQIDPQKPRVIEFVFYS